MRPRTDVEEEESVAMSLFYAAFGLPTIALAVLRGPVLRPVLSSHLRPRYRNHTNSIDILDIPAYRIC